jgi:hypothetical protein
MAEMQQWCCQNVVAHMIILPVKLNAPRSCVSSKMKSSAELSWISHMGGLLHADAISRLTGRANVRTPTSAEIAQLRVRKKSFHLRPWASTAIFLNLCRLTLKDDTAKYTKCGRAERGYSTRWCTANESLQKNPYSTHITDA